MKKPKRRLIRVVYRYRIVSRSTRPKTPSDTKKAITSTDQAKTSMDQEKAQNTTSTPKIASESSSTLATFDSHCNPYQQFIDNLSFSLTNLPTEVFTGATATTEPPQQEKDKKLDIAVEEAMAAAEEAMAAAEEAMAAAEEAMAAEKQDVTAEQKTITDVEETTTPKNNVKTIIHAGDIDPTSYEPTEIVIQTSPNLRYLPGIPSCFLASIPAIVGNNEKEAEENKQTKQG